MGTRLPPLRVESEEPTFPTDPTTLSQPEAGGGYSAVRHTASYVQFAANDDGFVESENHAP